MRRFLRILGALLLAGAVILLVIDGTHMLASSTISMTSLADAWDMLLPGRIAAAQAFVETSLHPLLWAPVITTLLSWPGWAVLGVLGTLIALAGRAPDRRHLVSIDQL